LNKSLIIKILLGIFVLGLFVFLILILKPLVIKDNKKNPVDTTITSKTKTHSEDTASKTPGTKLIQANLDKQIDSILFTFGIKKEWITSGMVIDKIKGQKPVTPKKNNSEAEWFTKNVVIPEDLASAEVNLDLSLFVNKVGLSPTATEDIKTKDISFEIRNLNDTSKGLPLVKINLTHSDKISRETGTFCFIINNIAQYKKDEIDNLLGIANEFSFVFPRNLENIDVQNKLAQSKKDILVNIVIGSRENSDVDFSLADDDKALNQRVKSFSTDFPNINKIILTRADPNPLLGILSGKLTEEFAKYNIRVIKDSLIVPLLNKSEEDSKERVGIMIKNLRAKVPNPGKGVSIINLSYDELLNLFDNLAVMKKLGYKFYTLSEYLNMEAQKQKKEVQPEYPLRVETKTEKPTPENKPPHGNIKK